MDCKDAIEHTNDTRNNTDITIQLQTGWRALECEDTTKQIIY